MNARTIAGAALVAFLAVCGAAVGEGPELVQGVNAMPMVPQRVNGTLRAEFAPNGTRVHVRIAETWRETGQPVRRFDVDMTKLMHLIVISDDLRSFQHQHPAVDANGVATLNFDLPKSGNYEIYADAVPHGAGQQVLRFPLRAGATDGTVDKDKDLAPTPATVAAGPYSVTLDSLKLAAGSTTMLTVRIAKNGKPAHDLHPYLGGAAHAVFIDASDYSYVHVHPMQGTDMSMGGMDMGGRRGHEMAGTGGEAATLPDSASIKPDMMLHVRVPKAGTYKLWLQFRGGSGLFVAPFVLTAA